MQATQSVPVTPILAVYPHPRNAVFDLAMTSMGQVVVSKDAYHAGDLVAHIPVGARLPAWVVARLYRDPLVSLGRPTRFTVEAQDCAGEVSQGVFYPVDPATFNDYSDDPEEGFVLHVNQSVVGVPGFVVRAGDNVANWLGITFGMPAGAPG